MAINKFQRSSCEDPYMVKPLKIRDENLPLLRGFPLFLPKFAEINCFRFDAICSNLLHFEGGIEGFHFFDRNSSFLKKNPVLIPEKYLILWNKWPLDLVCNIWYVVSTRFAQMMNLA